MLPKIATDMPATIIVVFVAPSQTIRRGARADFGRLFKTTIYHLKKTDGNLRWTAENKGIDDSYIGGKFPDEQKA